MDRPAQSRGFVLIAVLWIVGVLAMLTTDIVISARYEVRSAAGIRNAAVAQAAADGAVRHAAFQLIGGRWPTAGPPRLIRIGQAEVQIRIDDGALKLNPLTASPKDLETTLLPVVGDPARAVRLAGAIFDWKTRGPESVLGGNKVDQYRAARLTYRSADRPFESLDEIGLVVGMTPDVLAWLTPVLTLYQPGRAEKPPAPPADTPPVAAAAQPAPVRAVQISAVARVGSAARALRSATIRPHPEPGSGAGLFQTLAWDK